MASSSFCMSLLVVTGTQCNWNWHVMKLFSCFQRHVYTFKTRMHSSRMRTVRSSGCRGGVCVSQHALGRGCVYPSMHWAGGVYIPAYTGQGGVYPSMHWAGGVCQGGVCPGGCLPRGMSVQGVSVGGVSVQGVSALGGLARGVSAQGGCVCRGCVPGGVCAGGCLPQCMVGYTHTPVDRMTDACENITLPQLRC